MAGNISNVEARRLRYMVDTFGGQSGSPVCASTTASGTRSASTPMAAARTARPGSSSPVFDNMVAWKA